MRQCKNEIFVISVKLVFKRAIIPARVTSNPAHLFFFCLCSWHILQYWKCRHCSLHSFNMAILVSQRIVFCYSLAMIRNFNTQNNLENTKPSFPFFLKSCHLINSAYHRLCAWLHQWHPLIKPIYEGEE